MLNDIQQLNEYMKNKNFYSPCYQSFDTIYTFTTENQRGYMMDSANQEVLSVAGSGDQYLNLHSLGAKKVDSFDINKFALYHLKIKKAALMALSKEEFYDFFGNDARRYYSRVSQYLDYESLSFWNYYMREYVSNDRGFHRSRLFLSSFLSYRVFLNNIYLKNENYSSLQRDLLNHREEYCYHSDIYLLPNKLKQQYDSIYLSNISNYQKDINRYYYLVLTLYHDFLKKNGKLYYGYFYGEIPKKMKEALPNTQKIIINNAKGIENHHDYVYILKKNS